MKEFNYYHQANLCQCKIINCTASRSVAGRLVRELREQVDAVEDPALEEEIDEQGQHLAAREVDQHLDVKGVQRMDGGHGGRLRGEMDGGGGEF